jgi:hypothetical protein
VLWINIASKKEDAKQLSDVTHIHRRHCPQNGSSEDKKGKG